MKKTIPKKKEQRIIKTFSKTPVDFALKQFSKAGKATQAIVLISLLLVASGVFLSQADKIFAKAASSNITGTMVLTDRSGSIPNNMYSDQTAAIGLPGNSCTIIANICDVNAYSTPQTITIVINGVSTTVNSINEAQHNYYTCFQTIPTTVSGGLNKLNVYSTNNGLTYLSVAYNCQP